MRLGMKGLSAGGTSDGPAGGPAEEDVVVAKAAKVSASAEGPAINERLGGGLGGADMARVSCGNAKPMVTQLSPERVDCAELNRRRLCEALKNLKNKGKTRTPATVTR